MFSKNKPKFCLTVCEIFFQLNFSKFIQNFKTLNVFGKFLLIVKSTEAIFFSKARCFDKFNTYVI